ncbi:DUF7768 domain-containing protein [Lacrimispora sp.]|uniref:DUF7768 domain-containing protein n=1 Tax=Lacrimispora sp. TaxID=2719234 RepID=UPI0028AD86B3|nr:DUF4406 domain-containing protein [Lacrimispora sp.]
MKLIYVASPYAGDIEKNTEFARKACRYVLEQGHAFFAPHLLYPTILSESIPEQRQLGIEMGLTILAKCDELWVCGDMISFGIQVEIKLAKQLGIPICYVSTDHILGIKKGAYAIWARSRTDSPLAGQSGFLCEGNNILIFQSQNDAEIKVKDIRNLCLNTSPVAEFQCLTYPAKYVSESHMHLETIQKLDMIPSFTPNTFEVKSQIYGDTGGHCMVGTVQFYLPELDKCVWISCNDECVIISSADSTWNEDGSDSWERYEEVMLYMTPFDQEIPEDARPWLPMIYKTLEYTIEQETKYLNNYAFSLPVAWLPESIKKNADLEYLTWLQAEGKEAQVVRGGKIQIEKNYLQRNQNTFNMNGSI